MHTEKIKQQLVQYIEQTPSPLFITLLIDGLPVDIIYQFGQLQKITILDQVKHEKDVTKEVKGSVDLPAEISFKGFLKVRAHVIHTFSDYEKMNGNGEFLDHRDLTKKTIENRTECEQNKLRVIVSDSIDIIDSTIENSCSEIERLEFLIKQGFHVVYHEQVEKCSEEIMKYYRTFLEFHRKEIGYSVSGLQLIPASSHNCHDRFILPFPSDGVGLLVEDIHSEIYSNGKIKPVLKVKATDLAGERYFSHCLPNISLIKSLDIRIGDQILMEDVHTITGVIAEIRTGTEVCYVPPDVCPRCGELLKNVSGELYCIHPQCTHALDSIQDKRGVNGMTFVITGTLTVRRYEFRKLIEKAGGALAGVVTSQTNYLIVGSKGIGTVKYRKAQSLKIPMLSEEQFRMMIE